MDEEIEIRDLDAPPTNGLEGIFVLPENIAQDPRILAWYDEMVTQLRREAQGVPMTSAQYTLMERVAYNYANLRYQEFTNPGMSIRDKLALNDMWRKDLAMFNQLLEAHNDALMNEMLVKIQEILMERLSLVSNQTERSALRRALAEDFANLDI